MTETHLIINGTITLRAMYAGVGLNGLFKSQVYFGRKTLDQLSEIFSHVESIERVFGGARERFEEFTYLKTIERVDDDTVLVVMGREE